MYLAIEKFKNSALEMKTTLQADAEDVLQMFPVLQFVKSFKNVEIVKAEITENKTDFWFYNKRDVSHCVISYEWLFGIAINIQILAQENFESVVEV